MLIQLQKKHPFQGIFFEGHLIKWQGLFEEYKHTQLQKTLISTLVRDAIVKTNKREIALKPPFNFFTA